MSKEMEIRQECCNIWNKLKDKTQMIDCLIESKQQISDLEAKLAEKDYTIETLIEDSKASKEFLKKQLAEKDNLLKIYPRLEDMYPQLPTIVIGNQDKISFALEQLEKVKEELEFNSNNNEWITARDDRILNGICNFIDNQIKQLKEISNEK